MCIRDSYTLGLAAEPAAALRSFSTAWNGGGNAGAEWQRFSAAIEPLRAHGEAWARGLAGQRDLAAGLVKFCADRL